MAAPLLIVGLGNPGPRYANTRHNVGHLVIAELAKRCGARLTRHKSGALAAEARLGTGPGGVPGPRAVLAIPNSFMNVSGRTTSALLTFYGASVEDLLVIHDDLDLAPHTLRLKRGGGEGGHNGLKSISQALSSREYARLRIGIGRPPGRQDPADYVLRDFPGAERSEWAVTIQESADALEDVAREGFAAAQMRLHSA
ncbi:MAG: aminoacyl-tRNA hydrolase [Bowdeniella nasicola]|nr:aminoacyl-tRNA hydrolase [Bowdeniella nasicola]